LVRQMQGSTSNNHERYKPLSIALLMNIVKGFGHIGERVTGLEVTG
jgi:hypothetical protein